MKHAFYFIFLTFAVLPSCKKGDLPPQASSDNHNVEDVIPENKNQDIDVSSSDADEQRVRSLIAVLSSTNNPANPDARWPATFPEDYDQAAQKIVEQAVEKLIAEREKAIHLLLASVKNQDYCLSRNEETLKDYTVGEICVEIVQQMLTHQKMRTDEGFQEYLRQKIFEQDQAFLSSLQGGLKQIQEQLLKEYLAQQADNLDIIQRNEEKISFLAND